MYATCTGDLEVSGAEKPVKKKGLVFFRSNGEMHKDEIIIRNLDKTMELSRQSFL